MVYKCIRLFRGALVALGIATLCLMAIPMFGSESMIPYVLAGMFWLSMLAEWILMGIANHIRGKIEKISPHLKQERGFGKIGIFCFAQNREATVCDIALLVSAVILAGLIIFDVKIDGLVITGILATFVFFHMHCILNGILYKSIKHYQKVIHKRRRRK